MEKLKILVVDDESRMRMLVKDFLKRDGYEVLEAPDGEMALEIFFKEEQNDISLIILDVMMPKLDGWETLKEIRRFSNVPIIMLTAKTDERDELLGFELGVDEYISKPFSPKILVARVNAILRRISKSQEEGYHVGGIDVDIAAHEVRIEGNIVDLSYKEFELLKMLLLNRGIVLTRDKIMDQVWGFEYEGESRTVDMHIKTLRQKLGTAGGAIKTVRNVGYMIDSL